ncbi:winged helix-turn-helix domain-containing protein [Catellatospora sp. NPDC049609]|uniref:winged helix-turn-helix domain-containing protein n=1 Tax=Catellatospora sp. NPDC049609 TaxID=3155505 RepID=UPI00342EE616
MPPKRQSYRDIADDIEARIHRGEYQPGQELPSAAGWAEIYSVSKSTAERALMVLRERGLTEGVQGLGTFVAERRGK